MTKKTHISPSFGQLNTLYRVVDALIKTENVRVVFEFGSRYGEDTVELARTYSKATVYAFECNPKSLSGLKEKIKPFPNIVLTEKAIVDKNGVVEFYQIDEEKTKTTWVDGNQGASSVFKASGKYPVEKYSQKLIKVEAITLESFMQNNNIFSVDIMWVDIQGAELMALKGLGDNIKALKLLHLEVEFIEIYKGQPLFSAIHSYLSEHGFCQIGFSAKTHYSGDVIYANTRFFDNTSLKSAVNLIPQDKKDLSFLLAKWRFKCKYMGFKLKRLFFN